MPTYEVTAPDGRVFEVTAPDGASQSDVLAFAQKNYAPQRAQVTAPTKPKTLAQSAGDLVAGGVRGAGSIGATIVDFARSLGDSVMDATPANMRPDVTSGLQDSPRGSALRSEMDAGLRTLGADTNSLAFKTGKLGAEIAGTAGVGNAVARPVQMLANTRLGAGIEPIIEGVSKGLQTGGFRVGPLAGTSAALPTRVATGAITGGATVGLANPDDAGQGAVIGGAIPGLTHIVGRTAELAGSKLHRSAPSATPEMLNTAGRSMDAGYVIPPSMVNPSFRNRTLESLSGKFETAQLAATRNQQVTDDLVRASLGMPKSAPLTFEAMQAFRTQQHQIGYEPVKQVGMIPAGKKFNDALDDLVKQYTGKGTIPAIGKEKAAISELVNGHKSAGFDSADAIDAIRILRESADEAFRKGENALGKTYKGIAQAYEGAIDDALGASGQRDLLATYRAARQNIAKTYTIEKGLRAGAGTVDARALGRELQKKKPLTGELRTVAEFGNAFNKAAQPPQLIGSPGVNVLKPALSLLTGAGGAAAMGPAGVALGAGNYVVPPVARSIMFSPQFQRGLLSAPQVAGDAPMGLLTQSARTLPLLSAQ